MKAWTIPVIVVLSLFFLAGNTRAESITSLQYQEFANATDTSSWNDVNICTGDGCENDGDWSTLADGLPNYLYENYTKPYNLNSVIWTFRDIGNTYNVSIPSDCLSHSLIELSIVVSSTGIGSENLYSCFNSTDWVLLQNNTYVGAEGFYEDGVYWNVTTQETVSACATLTGSHLTYLLDTNLYGQAGSCFRIDGTDVIFDCQNYLIEGDGTGSSDTGVRISSAGNVTVQNCIINHFAIGVRVPFYAGTSADNVAIKNIQTTNNYTSGTVYGIYVLNSTNILVDNVTVTNSSTSTGSRYGMYFDVNSDSIIRNSRFIGLSIGVYYPTYVIDALVQNNEFINMTNYGFRFPSTASITNATLDSNSFSGNRIYNIFYSQFSTLATPSVCEQMTITGNTGKGGLPILFYNTAGQTIENRVNDVADIMLCNSSGSVIRNVLCEDTCENFIFTYADNLEIENVTLNKYHQFLIYKSPTAVTLTDVELYNATYNVLTCSGVSCSISDSIISSITPFTRVGSGANLLFGGYLYNTTTPMEFNLTNSLIEGYALTSPTGYASALDTFTNFRANIVNSILRGNQSAFMASNTSGNVTIRDSTLSRLSADTVYADFKSYGNVANGSKYDFYNVTFSTYNISSNTALNVYWKLAINNTFGADIIVKDNNSATLLTTNTSFDYWAKEYNVTATNVKTDEPTKMITLDLSKTGYVPISLGFDMITNIAYTISLSPTPTPAPIDSLPDIFVQLVLTLGFGIIAIFACLTLIVSKEDVQVLYQPENFIKLIIAVTIVILMLVGVWMGLVI